MLLLLLGWLWRRMEANDRRAAEDRDRYERLLVSTTDNSAAIRLLTDLYKDSRERHETLLVGNTEISTQVKYLTGMIQSEKGTSARVHAEVFQELKELREEIRDRLPDRRDHK